MELNGSSRSDKGAKKVNIYEVLFPNSTTFFFSAKEDIGEFIHRFSQAKGFKTFSGSVYNPKQYISITPVDAIQAGNLQIRVLNKVLIE